MKTRDLKYMQMIMQNSPQADGERNALRNHGQYS